MRIHIFLILSITCAISLSCESPVSPESPALYFYTSQTVFKLDQGDGRSETVRATIRKVQSDSIQLFLSCWPWDNLQIFQGGKWQHYQPRWELNYCDEWDGPFFLSDSVSLSWQFQSTDSISPGLYRFLFRYKMISVPWESLAYSNGFMFAP